MALSVAPPRPHLVPPVARAASSGSRAPARGALGGAPGQLPLGTAGELFQQRGELVWLLNHLNPNLFGYG